MKSQLVKKKLYLVYTQTVPSKHSIGLFLCFSQSKIMINSDGLASLKVRSATNKNAML